jgi:hypothetical protein
MLIGALTEKQRRFQVSRLPILSTIATFEGSTSRFGPTPCGLD